MGLRTWRQDHVRQQSFPSHYRGRGAPRTLAVGLARTAEEVEQIQRLRYDVFTEDMGAVFPQAQDGVEQDRFDQWCEHLMVREL
ncbi:acetyltransferase (GNAT) domain protein, partial [Bordetella bronchiseptica E012]|uniref:GNAT family N-acetyltransferase n=1 Tax=Bordetella bronchiseptica TaxID=518 RepID=UPI00046109BE